MLVKRGIRPINEIGLLSVQNVLGYNYTCLSIVIILLF